ncbi:MAG: hypothetical protein WCF90_07775, partial [Methanomicrobiales archaeon]
SENLQIGIEHNLLILFRPGIFKREKNFSRSKRDLFLLFLWKVVSPRPNEVYGYHIEINTFEWHIPQVQRDDLRNSSVITDMFGPFLPVG